MDLILYRIVDKTTGIYIRDSFSFNTETEIGLEVKGAEGLIIPKWNGEAWVEGATEADILAAQQYANEMAANQPATIEEMFNALYGV